MQTWPEKDPIFAAALGSLAILLDLIRQAINTYALELRRARALDIAVVLDDVMGAVRAVYCVALRRPGRSAMVIWRCVVVVDGPG